jgi:hypothetical protein
MGAFFVIIYMVMVNSSPHLVLKNKIRKDEKILHVFVSDEDYINENPLRYVPNAIMVIICFFTCLIILISMRFPNSEGLNRLAYIFYFLAAVINSLLAFGIVAYVSARRARRVSFEYDYNKKPAAPTEDKSLFKSGISSYNLRIYGITMGLETFLIICISPIGALYSDYSVMSLLLFLISLIGTIFSMISRKTENLAVAITNQRLLFMDAKRYIYKYVELNHPLRIWKDYDRHIIHLVPDLGYDDDMPVYDYQVKLEARKYEKGDQVSVLTIRGLGDDEYLLYLATKTNKHLCKK